MKVEITAEAEADLEHIAAYIATDNPARALSFIEELSDRCLELADMPLAFPLVPRHEGWGVRLRVHGSYLIFYRADDTRVVVLHILHGAMDYTEILFGS